MKFKTGTIAIVGRDKIKPNELSAKEQKKLIKEFPHLEHFVVYENDKPEPKDSTDVQPKQESSKRGKRKSKAD